MAVMTSLVDWIFRPQCVGCGEPAVTLCEACRASLVELGPACARCAEPIEDATAGRAYAQSGAQPDMQPSAQPDMQPSAQTGPPDAQHAQAGAEADAQDGAEADAQPGAQSGAPDTDAMTCRRCATRPLPIDRVVAPWRFGGQLASAIRRLKFANRAHIARDVAPLWAPVLAAAVAEHDAIVIAVPLHWRRRCVRGYDHAWLLADHACALAGIAPPVAALRRVRHAVAQSTLPAAERAANVAGAFAIDARRFASVAGRAVVLVDDVMTTGATLGAAATTLRRAGAGAITALVLARATVARE
jgi:ComF family protein